MLGRRVRRAGHADPPRQTRQRAADIERKGPPLPLPTDARIRIVRDARACGGVRIAMSTTKPHADAWVKADVLSRRPSADPTRYTVEDRTGARGQRLHAFAILVVPAVAVCVAAWD